ncbi:hypothetical protein [Methylobacterium nonmethylotrophicum]|uniref:Uncharacterized protein n=1 Tax=Methylobacterium nonmethylotrophicum TaxID=1141884 RepID=A0A4Z0NE38_9HYPH|nr:hypothetical protein [Methylobacterium nonmethylotrophicum]TGD91806.1 hypothetical protein EU555_35510 [Methylobacterium nonmethylotrophicum]
MSPTALTRKPQDASTITAALLALLTALEGIPAGSPAGAAYTAAIRRRGEELAAVGGAEALRSAHAVVLAAAPDQAETRAALIDSAWSTIPGWTDTGSAA